MNGVAGFPAVVIAAPVGRQGCRRPAAECVVNRSDKGEPNREAGADAEARGRSGHSGWRVAGQRRRQRHDLPGDAQVEMSLHPPASLPERLAEGSNPQPPGLLHRITPVR